MRQCVFHYSAVCFHCVCICLVSLSTHLQRSFQLEDANDIEIRQLKEKVASMTAESQTTTSKLQQQDEQSEEEHTYVVRYNQVQVYIGQTSCIHISLHTYVCTYVCANCTFVYTSYVQTNISTGAEGHHYGRTSGHYCNY